MTSLEAGTNQAKPTKAIQPNRTELDIRPYTTNLTMTFSLHQSEGCGRPRTAYAIPGRVGYGGGSCRRVRRRFYFHFRHSRRVGRGRSRGTLNAKNLNSFMNYSTWAPGVNFGSSGTHPMGTKENSRQVLHHFQMGPFFADEFCKRKQAQSTALPNRKSAENSAAAAY